MRTLRERDSATDPPTKAIPAKYPQGAKAKEILKLRGRFKGAFVEPTDDAWEP